MNQEKYEKMKEMILALNELWNTPNSLFEEIFNMSWAEYHELRRQLEEE